MTSVPDDWERDYEQEKTGSVVMAWKKGKIKVWVEDQSYDGKQEHWQPSITHTDLEYDDETLKEYQPMRHIPGNHTEFAPRDRLYIGDVDEAIRHAKEFIKQHPNVDKTYFKEPLSKYPE